VKVVRVVGRNDTLGVVERRELTSDFRAAVTIFSPSVVGSVETRRS
jgi:hypothetical protein